MADLLINGTTYNDVKQIQIPLSSGNGNAKFVEENDDLGKKIANTLTEYSNDELTTLPTYAFYECTSIITASFPNVTTVKEEAFSKCSNLETVDLSSCKTLGANAFYNCKKLKNITLGEISRLERQIFYGCAIESFESNSAGLIYNDGIFSNCTSLKRVSLPNINNVSGGMVFYNCTSLTEVDFGSANNIYPQTFYGCTALESITLRGLTMAVLKNINAFDNCSGRTINVYVPESLIETYQSDETWSAVTGATLNFIALT